MPSPERLYTQKSRLAVGTLLNTVSIFSVSIEKDNCSPEDAENESSFPQAAQSAIKSK